jgi:hypothetical protein
LVETVDVFVPLSAKMPLAPEAGAINVTSAPLTGLPELSTTYTTRGFENEIKVPDRWFDPSEMPKDAAGLEEIYS